MRISLRLLVLTASMSVLSVRALAGCSSSPGHAGEGSDDVARASAPIIGGVADTTHTWAVGIDIGGYGICSGTLIAPNLVLTARHCVSKTPTQLDCRPDGGLTTSKVLSNYPASSFKVTTAQRIGGAPQWTVKAVRYIDDPLADTLCGYDLALLELNPAGTTGFPKEWVAPSFVPPVRSNYIAIGYGCQNPEGVSGGGCDPRGYRMLLDPAYVIEVAEKEFVISGRVCGGDSGGPVWNETKNVVYGALSRGDGTTATAEGCNFGVYTRTDAHVAWLQKYGRLAATAGGYAPVEWMTATPPVPDAGVPKSANGQPCARGAECVSNVCITFGDRRLCTEKCSATDPCSDGFTCNGGYCYPLPPSVDAGPTEPEPAPVPAAEDADAAVVTPASDTIRSGGCTVGRDFPPPKPQPWILAGAAALAVVIARRRPR